MTSDCIEIEILNWEKYNPRGDTRRPSWFRFENSLIDDPQFFRWSAEEFKALVYILSMASRKNSGRVLLFFDHANDVCGVSELTLRQVIQKMVFKQTLAVLNDSRADTARVSVQEPHASVQEPHATNERTGRDGTGRTGRYRARRNPPEPAGTLPALPRVAEESGTGVAVWEAYRDEYQNRYGANPVRNASVNAKLSQFAKRLPAEEAPEVARFYVRHPDAFYVKQLHPVGLLLKDAEALRTQWARGRAITGTDARTVERRVTNAGNIEAAFAEVARRKQEVHGSN